MCMWKGDKGGGARGRPGTAIETRTTDEWLRKGISRARLRSDERSLYFYCDADNSDRVNNWRSGGCYLWATR